MGGLLGRLFQEFAVTIGVAILVSGFVSLTLTPMLCSRFLKPHGEERHGLGFGNGVLHHDERGPEEEGGRDQRPVSERALRRAPHQAV